MINKSSFFLLFLFLCFSAVVFVFLCFLLWLMSLWCFSFFLFLNREFWTINLPSFRNCKMKTTQILLLKLWLFSFKILRGFSMSWPGPCEKLISSLQNNLLFLLLCFPFILEISQSTNVVEFLLHHTQRSTDNRFQ